MSDDSVPVAVVGVGHMGTNHVRVYDELKEAELTEVIEPRPERAERIREEYDVTVSDSIEDIDEAVAASIAVPSDEHRSTAETLIEMGLDVLVEKPLAPTVTEAQSLAQTAHDHGATLQVGHIERFNPAMETLGGILEDEEIISVEAKRLGPFSDRLSDIDVVSDLMIHDLDVLDWILNNEIVAFNALGTKIKSEELDHAVVQFETSGGVLATATASHVTHNMNRSLRVATHDAFIEMDFQDQSIVIQHRGIEETTTLFDQSGYRTEVVSESPYIQTREPLKNELEHFVDCVATGKKSHVGATEGLRAVRLVERVKTEIESGDGVDSAFQPK